MLLKYPQGVNFDLAHFQHSCCGLCEGHSSCSRARRDLTFKATEAVHVGPGDDRCVFFHPG